MQACNAHGLRCVPLYDTLGMYLLQSIAVLFTQLKIKNTLLHINSPLDPIS